MIFYCEGDLFWAGVWFFYVDGQNRIWAMSCDVFAWIWVKAMIVSRLGSESIHDRVHMWEMHMLGTIKKWGNNGQFGAIYFVNSGFCQCCYWGIMGFWPSDWQLPSHISISMFASVLHNIDIFWKTGREKKKTNFVYETSGNFNVVVWNSSHMCKSRYESICHIITTWLLHNTNDFYNSNSWTLSSQRWDKRHV